ncbi:vacuolar morphogenesis protein [Niveomyces insectorum RCEF 264]|uniref:Vacuolar morphogenesis protein n=1 Tax=Niveomyces insectorum RCEF 264 TaxID=1081102 RepID=A0A162MGZ2_9HYPO|nr:vacuolar morphogenesis protein [Niveomyces insectorum RCEF 264]
MLTAFTARPIVELKARDKSRIESLVAYGDRLLVGLHTGVLRIYRVPEPEPESEPDAGPEATPAAEATATAKSVDSPKTKAPAALLLREVEKFAPRAIEQLAIIKEANTLVALANYAVSLHDLRSFAPLPGAHPLPGTKNATAFAVTSNIVKDPATGIPEIVSRLAVAVKRRLLLWSWYASELSGDGAAAGGGGGGGGSGGGSHDADNVGGRAGAELAAGSEITLPETIRSLTWASATKVVVGMNAGYALVDVLTRTVEEMAGTAGTGGGGGGGGIGTGNSDASSGVSAAASRFGALGSASMGYMGLGNYMPKPLAAKLADGVVLLAKDVHTLFVTADAGRPLLDKRPIPWPTAPESIGYSYPYILALQPPARGSLEVRNPDTLSVLQTLALPGAAQLHVPPPSLSLAHAGKGFHVASERGIWKMDATDYDSQVAALVAQGQLDEAISLLGLLEDALLRNKAQTLRAVKMQKAEQLFRRRRYQDAMDLFNEEDVHAPPARVLRFFPRSIAGDLSDEGPPAAAAAGNNGDENGDKAPPDHPHQASESPESSTDDDAAAASAASPPPPPSTTTTTTGATNGNGHDGAHDMATPSSLPPASPALSALAKQREAAVSPPPAPELSSSLPRAAASGFSKMFRSRRGADPETASIASSRKGGGTESDAWAGPPAKDKKTGEDTAAATTSTTRASTTNTTAAATQHTNGYVPLEGKELLRAAEALNSYLAGTRARLQRVIDPATGKLKPRKRTDELRVLDTADDDSTDLDNNRGSDRENDHDDAAREARLRVMFTLVDTTMFRVLMLIRPKLASSLFRIPNFCDPAVVNERLLARSRYNELVNFFYGKRLHRQALELLKRFGEVTGEDRDDETRTMTTTTTMTDEEGEDTTTTTTTVKVPPALRGPQRTIAYLQSLPPDMIDLVLEFAAWTLRADPARGMEVFLADSENAETLPRDRVVRFLAGIDPRLEMQYLAHVIGELNDLTPEFHNRLIEQMIKQLQDRKPVEKAESANKEHRTAAEAEAEAEAEAGARDSNGAAAKPKQEGWDASMARLVAFLKESRQYSLSRAFALIPRQDPAFYEAQAVVLSNMGQHKQALDIYVFKMKDFDKAEEYCNRIYKTEELAAQSAPASTRSPASRESARRTSSSGGRTMTTTTTAITNNDGSNDSVDDEKQALYGRQDTHPPSPSPSAPAAASIYHPLLGLYLTPPPPHAPQLMPALALLAHHGARLPAASTLQLIPDGLPEGGRGPFLSAAAAAPAGRNRRVVVSEERVCGVCHKRLGGSVVAVLPDNAVVHYGCLHRSGGGGVDGSRAPWR